jgi:hypothetical protein
MMGTGGGNMGRKWSREIQIQGKKAYFTSFDERYCLA